MLNQRSLAVNVQALQAVADAQYGLSPAIRIVEQQSVNVIAPLVGLRGV